MTFEQAKDRLNQIQQHLDEVHLSLEFDKAADKKLIGELSSILFDSIESLPSDISEESECAVDKNTINKFTQLTQLIDTKLQKQHEDNEQLVRAQVIGNAVSALTLGPVASITIIAITASALLATLCQIVLLPLITTAIIYLAFKAVQSYNKHREEPLIKEYNFDFDLVEKVGTILSSAKKPLEPQAKTPHNQASSQGMFSRPQSQEENGGDAQHSPCPVG